MRIDDSFYEAAKLFLTSLDAPLTPENVNIVAAWSYCEKPHWAGAAWQWNNPLNTTLACCGWTGNANAVGVKIYPTKEAGIEANRRTILGRYYSTLVQALKNSNPGLFLSAEGEIRTWGTNPGCIASIYHSLGPPPDWAVTPPTPTCPEGTYYDPNTGQCVSECPEGTYYDPATGQCVSGAPPSWPLWFIPVLMIPTGLAGAGLIFMSRKNMTFSDVKLLVKEKFGRWSHGK